MYTSSLPEILKRTYIYICLLAVLSIAGCRPRNVLSSREMRAVLHDLHRADAVLQVAGYNYGNDEALAKYYQTVLDKHGVTQAQFDSSLVWYTDHPQRFDKIYPRVVASLEQERDQWLATHETVSLTLSPDAVQDTPRMSEEDARRATDSLLWHAQYGLRIRYLLGPQMDILQTDTIVLYPIGNE